MMNARFEIGSCSEKGVVILNREGGRVTGWFRAVVAENFGEREGERDRERGKCRRFRVLTVTSK